MRVRHLSPASVTTGRSRTLWGRAAVTGAGLASLLLLALVLMLAAVGPAAAAVGGPVPVQDTGPLLTPEPDDDQSEPADDPSEVDEDTSGPAESPDSDVQDDPAQTSQDGGPTAVELALHLLLGLAGLALALLSTALLWSTLYAWRSRSALRRTGFVRSTAAPARSFTLVPAERRSELVADSLERLAAQDHPDVQVVAIVGHDDPHSDAAARSVAERHPDRVEVVVDYSVRGNRASALNRALPVVRGDVVGVVGIADDVHPHLLTRVDQLFETTGAHVVQGGVQQVDDRRTWWSTRHALDQFLWYRSRVHLGADRGLALLGGGTSFISASWLLAADGWDEDCLAEDCELGIWLSAKGARVAAAYEPEIATRTAGPPTLRSVIERRTRLDRGLRQVRRKGGWRGLPTRSSRALARLMLAMPVLSPAVRLLALVSVLAAILVPLPTAVAMLLLLPAAPSLVALAVEIVALRDLGRAQDRRPGARDHLRILLGALPCQLLLALAAIRSRLRPSRPRSGTTAPSLTLAENAENAESPASGSEEDSEPVSGSFETDDEETAVGDEPELVPEVEDEIKGEPEPGQEAEAEQEQEPDPKPGSRRRHAPVAAPAPGVDETPTTELALGWPVLPERDDAVGIREPS